MDRAKVLALVTCLALFAAGCNSGDRDVTPQGNAPDGGPLVNQGTKPGGAGGQSPTDLATQEEPLHTIPLKQAKAEYDKAKKAFASDPAKAKQAYVDATNTLADSTMMANELEPKQKYGPALQLYREVLKTDPANVHAQRESEQIISIYKSMGRPVPGGG